MVDVIRRTCIHTARFVHASWVSALAAVAHTGPGACFTRLKRTAWANRPRHCPGDAETFLAAPHLFLHPSTRLANRHLCNQRYLLPTMAFNFCLRQVGTGMHKTHPGPVLMIPPSTFHNRPPTQWQPYPCPPSSSTTPAPTFRTPST